MKNQANVVVTQSIIPELFSGSSTQAVTQQQALKTLKKFQGLSYFTTTRGFTLIELLVVVLIIGILAAVAVPQYQRVTLKSRVASVLSMGRAVQVAQEVYYFENGVYTDTMDKLDIDGKCPPGWKCFWLTDRFGIQNDDGTFGINFAYEHAPQLVAGKIYCWANKKNNDLFLNLCRSYGSDLGGNPDRYMAEIVQ